MLYEPLLLNNLRRLCTAFAASKGYSMGTVQRRIMGTDRFFETKTKGGAFTVALYDLCVCRFAFGWSVGVPWPEDIPRPTDRHIAKVLAKFPIDRKLIARTKGEPQAKRVALAKRAKRVRASRKPHGVANG